MRLRFLHGQLVLVGMAMAVGLIALVGGMISATILTLIVIPAIYALVKEFRISRGRTEILSLTKGTG